MLHHNINSSMQEQKKVDDLSTDVLHNSSYNIIFK